MDKLKKTILIVGAGPGLGLSVAKKFGSEGFNVALLARNPLKMDLMLNELRSMGITAEGFLADYLEPEELENALNAAIERFGFIDTVEIQMIGTKGAKSSSSTKDTLESRKVHASAGVIGLDSTEVMNWLECQMVPLIHIVNKMLPQMQLQRQNYVSGFIVTLGWSALWPGEVDDGGVNELPYHILRKVPCGVAFATVVKYLEFLNAQMHFDNIYATANVLASWIKEGTPHNPDIIAADMYDRVYMPKQNDPFERRKVVYTFPESVRNANDMVRY